MSLKGRVKTLEDDWRASAGFTVICTGAGKSGPMSWAEVGEQRIERFAGETEQAFLDRAAALGKPNTEIVHVLNAVPSLETRTGAGD